MKRGMFHTAVVPINRYPVFDFVLNFGIWKLFGNWCLGFEIFAYAISDIVPRTTRPIRHGVHLSLRRSAALRAFDVYPLLDSRKRRFSGIGRFVILYFMQLH